MLSPHAEQSLPPERILPAQFSGMWHRRPRSPGEMLALAILSQAINDMRHYRSARYSWARRTYFDARRYIFSDNRSYPFSFLNVCDVLRISSSALRAHMREIDNAAPAPAVTEEAA